MRRRATSRRCFADSTSPFMASNAASVHESRQSSIQGQGSFERTFGGLQIPLHHLCPSQHSQPPT